MDPQFVDNYVMTSMFDHDYAPFQKSGSKAKHDELESLAGEGQASYPEQKKNADGAGERKLDSLTDDKIKSAEKAFSWQGRRLFSTEDGESNPDHEKKDVPEQQEGRHDEHASVDTSEGDHHVDATHSIHVATPNELVHDAEEHLDMELDSNTTEHDPSNDHPFRHPGGHDDDDDQLLDHAGHHFNTNAPTEVQEDDYETDMEHQFEGRHHYGMHGDDMSYMGE